MLNENDCKSESKDCIEKLFESISAECGISVENLKASHSKFKCPICCESALRKKDRSDVDNMQEYYCVNCGDYALYGEADNQLNSSCDEKKMEKVIFGKNVYDLKILRNALKQCINSYQNAKWKKSIRFCEKNDYLKDESRIYVDIRKIYGTYSRINIHKE